MLLIILGVVWLLFDATVNDFLPEYEEALSCDKPDTGSELPDTLSLMSWNLGYAGLGAEMDFFYDGGRRVRPDEEYFKKCRAEIMEYLTQQRDNDFLLLQEVDHDAKRSWFSDLAGDIGQLMEDYCSNFAINYNVKYVPVPLGRPMGRVVSGIQTLSKVTPASATRVALPGSFGWPKRLFMLNRCIMVNRYPLGNGHDLVVINLHNSAFDETGNLRRQEMEHIRSIILEEYGNGNSVIAGGDWNMNPPGFGPGSITTDSVFTIRHGIDSDLMPEGWTWVWDPEYPTNRDVSEAYTQGTTGTTILDFFLLSPDIRLIEVKTEHLGFSASDHNPVKIRVALDRAGQAQ